MSLSVPTWFFLYCQNKSNTILSTAVKFSCFLKRSFYCLFVIQKLFGKVYQNRSNYNHLRIQNSFLSYKMIRHYLRLYVKKMIHFSLNLVNNHRQTVNWNFMPVLGYKTVPTINFEHDAGRLRETSEWWSWLFGQIFFRKLILEKDGASVLLLISGSNFQSFWAFTVFFRELILSRDVIPLLSQIKYRFTLFFVVL